MTRLALFGGPPAIAGDLPPYISLGDAERAAVNRVMDSGCLSGFYGSPGPHFNGGPEVQALEAEWCAVYDVAHAVTVNSNTTGLLAAMGAIGLSPGDEVIVPPYTMSATALAPLFYGGVPVFCDVEDETFGLDPERVAAAITPRTRAIMAVNLFGHPARLAALRAIADANGLFMVEDNAQSPLGVEDGRRCGTVGHIGVFSLNYHKHFHSGEGGVCVTQDDQLARRMRLIRNHGENACLAMGETDLTNMVGLNLRMTELTAAIARTQLHDRESHVGRRERLAEALTQAAADLTGLRPPVVREGCRHNYYCWALRYDAAATGVPRELFLEALNAEGLPVTEGFLRPLYMLPLFQERRAIGRDGFPFNLSDRDYSRAADACPTVERLESEEIMLFEPCLYDPSDSQIAQLQDALRKVHAGLPQLRDHLGTRKHGAA